MKTLGIIGSGMIGSQVARLAVAAGLDVVISSTRGPESLHDLITELEPLARAATTQELIASTEIIIAAIPLVAYKNISAEALAGKIVVDTMNYYPERDGVMAEIHTDDIASSEHVQSHFHQSRVVKAINNMDWVRLLTRARPAGAEDRNALPVASDEAKVAVINLLDAQGYDAVDMGNLPDSWKSEPTMPAYVLPYMGGIPKAFTDMTEREWFMTAPGAVVSRKRLSDLLSRAKRHDKMFGSITSMAGASL